MEGRILQFTFIFMAVSAGICPKFPEELWDVEQDDTSFYFSSWQRDSVKNPNKTENNQTQKNPKHTKNTQKNPEEQTTKLSSSHLYFAVCRYLEKQEASNRMKLECLAGRREDELARSSC